MKLLDNNTAPPLFEEKWPLNNVKLYKTSALRK